MKFLKLSALALLGSALFAVLALAASDAPTINDPLTPVDADKAVLSGTAKSGDKIIVTGGPFQLPPTYADDNGNWEMEVALIQESTNTFQVQAQTGDDDPSDAIEIMIEEGETVTADFETSTGGDHTAPDPVSVDETTVSSDDATYTITGTAEANSTLLISGATDDSVEIGSDGTFSVEVNLSGDNLEDTFTLTVQDDTGNISAGTKVRITSSADTSSIDEEEEELTDGDTVEDAQSNDFLDTQDHWAREFIRRLFDIGAVQGYDDGRFGPDDAVTRAQVLKMSIRAFGHTEITRDGDRRFLDVADNAWHAVFIKYAFAQGWIDGYADNSFRPDNPVSRAAALKIILKVAGVEGLNDVTDNFEDVDVANDWFAIYTSWAKRNGIVGGFDDGSFRAGQATTRAEVAKIILRVKDHLEQE